MNSLAPPAASQLDEEEPINFEAVEESPAELTGEITSRGTNALAPLADPQLNESESPTNFQGVDEAPAELAGEVTNRGMNALATRSDPQLNEDQGATNFESVDEAPAELEGEIALGGMNSLATGADPQLNEQTSPVNFSQDDDSPPSSGSISGKQDVFTATLGQTVFPLSHSGILGGSESVCINGLRQPNTEYSVAGSNMTFNDGTGVSAGDIVTVSYLY